MQIAIAGLGKMGSQIAQKLVEDGHEVIAHNRHADKVDAAAKFGAKPAYTKAKVVELFNGQPATVWLMIPANVIDEELDDWLSVLPAGSTIIDGGNSDYRLDGDRAKKTKVAKCHLLDVGTSGGVWGYKRGFCMMAGGDKEIFKTIEPALQTLAKPTGGYDYFGDNGAGHFVKMVHNAIEYGMMESLAEGYMMLKNGPVKDIDLARAGELWQKNSVISSWLNELSANALAESPDLADNDGRVAESGEARWTLEIANEHKLPMPAIQAAFDVRTASMQGQTNFATRLLAAMRNKFGGHLVNPDK